MQPMDVAQHYFDAWNNHDAAGIVASFVEGGTYHDPTSGGLLTGPAIGAYASGLWSAFPNLSFELVSAAPAGHNLIAAQWVMHGVNTGSMNGLPPTGQTVKLPGADFIQIEGDKIRSVAGYFDSREVPAQLGLQVIVQPHGIGPFSFGTSVRVANGRQANPGAFSITALQARSEQEKETIRNQSRQIATEMLKMEGFISFVGVMVGDRMLTITAWENSENSKQLMRGGTHAAAMKAFFGSELAVGGITGIWTPERIGTSWVRCPRCGKMAGYEKAGGVCSCGESLPQPPTYW